MRELSYELADAEATQALGAVLGPLCRDGARIHLFGDLGAGKTTLVRGLLRGLGHRGAVRSPTYTLIEPYELEALTAYHLDLYRLGDAEELEWIGIRDLLDEDQLLLVEWPERGQGVLPAADLHVRLYYQGSGRRVVLAAQSERGDSVLARLVEEKIN